MYSTKSSRNMWKWEKLDRGQRVKLISVKLERINWDLIVRVKRTFPFLQIVLSLRNLLKRIRQPVRAAPSSSESLSFIFSLSPFLPLSPLPLSLLSLLSPSLPLSLSLLSPPFFYSQVVSLLFFTLVFALFLLFFISLCIFSLSHRWCIFIPFFSY